MYHLANLVSFKTVPIKCLVETTYGALISHTTSQSASVQQYSRIQQSVQKHIVSHLSVVVLFPTLPDIAI
jgi:hypothetical protein